MKKEYSKPNVIFEDFSLSTSVSLNCEVDVNFARGSCGRISVSPGVYIFTADMTGCTTGYKREEHNGVCYHNPTETNNMFNS